MKRTLIHEVGTPIQSVPLDWTVRGLLVAFAFSALGTPPAYAQAGATHSVAEPLAVVRVSNANLRARPSIDGAIVGRLSRGDTVRIAVERPEGWSRVQARGRDAWIKTSLLNRLQWAAQPSQAPTSPAATDARPLHAASVREGEDHLNAPPPHIASTTPDDGVDPRLAGRRRRTAGASSTIPASSDRSRIGLMAGVATGAWSITHFTGPALRVYSRTPLTQSPFAMRADVEVSRVSAGNLPNDSHWRLSDARAVVGAEFGVPVMDHVEISVVGSLGVARQALSVRMYGADVSGPPHWRVAHDVGVGAKISRMLIVELHFFSSDGAPVRLLAGVRL